MAIASAHKFVIVLVWPGGTGIKLPFFSLTLLLQAHLSGIFISVMKPTHLTLWPLLLLFFSLMPLSKECKPAPKSKAWDPMCKDNPTVQKICPLDLTHKCPNLLLSDFSTNQNSFDSHNSENIGLINWSSNIGLHGQSSVLFFFLGSATTLAIMLAISRCKQTKKHKRSMRELLTRIASSSAAAASTAQGPQHRAAVLPLFPPGRLQLGQAGREPDTSGGALPQLQYQGEFIPLT